MLPHLPVQINLSYALVGKAHNCMGGYVEKSQCFTHWGVRLVQRSLITPPTSAVIVCNQSQSGFSQGTAVSSLIKYQFGQQMEHPQQE